MKICEKQARTCLSGDNCALFFELSVMAQTLQICAAQKYFLSEPELRSSESKQALNQISHGVENLLGVNVYEMHKFQGQEGCWTDTGKCPWLFPMDNNHIPNCMKLLIALFIYCVNRTPQIPLESPDDGVGGCIKGTFGVNLCSCALTWLKQWFVRFLHLCLPALDLHQW